MLGRKTFENKPVMICLEDLVPKDDFLRQVTEIIDFSFIPPLVADCYSQIGRRSIDPIVVIKILLIGFFCRITSERRLMREIQVNLSYRLFVGYNLDEQLPDHSSLTKIRDRFGRQIFQEIFDHIVEQCIQHGLVKGEHISFDATLVPADASLSSMKPRLNVVHFTNEIFDKNSPEDDLAEPEPENQDNRPELTLIKPNTTEEKQRKKKRGHPLKNATHVSQTDADATISKSKTSMMTLLSYKDNISVDSANRIIMDCMAITGANDEAIDLLDRFLRIKYRFGLSFKELSADTKFGTEKNFKGLEDLGVEGFIPIRKSGENTTTGLYPLDKFKYDEEQDVLICPAGQQLVPKPYLIQERFRLFLADRDTCLSCSQREQCTRIGQRRPTGRAVCISVNKACIERAKIRVKTAKGRRANIIRKTRVETIFGEAKSFHGLSRAKWRGLAKVHIQFLMTATAQNIKRMVQVLTLRRKAANTAVAQSLFHISEGFFFRLGTWYFLRISRKLNLQAYS
jgi:transposase